MTSITGLDVGGAHLKAAQIGPDGRVSVALQVPCALWQGLDRLAAACAELRARLAATDAVGVTMTGELADLFPDRPTGVVALARAVGEALPASTCRFWAGDRGFVTAAEVPGCASEIASANWLATARLVAARLEEAVLVDVGSTTTDIVLVAGGRVRAAGGNDRDRLATGELVYTGLTRTPLMALAASAPFAGRRVAVMAELFATTADVHRVLHRLAEDADQHAAADGGAKDWTGSARRLARMVGADLADGGPAAWRALAGWFARAQLRRIEDALHLQLSRGLVGAAAPIVGAGCGRFLARALAASDGRRYRDFAELVETAPAAADGAAAHAPAVAVALLLAGRG